MHTLKDSRADNVPRNKAGFTLVELLMAMFMVSIAMGAIYAVYVTVNESYTHQRELAHMQQNLRAAMYMIKEDIRNSGRNSLMDGSMGITDIGRWNPDADDPNGYPGITLTTLRDNDLDGAADGTVRRIAYRVFDSDGDGRRELRRWDSLNPAATWDLVFDGIEDISFAYAFDNDDDQDLDRSVAGVGGPATVMWGIDTDNVAGLDTNADNVPDGDINALDDTDGDGDIDNVDGGLGMQVPLTDIRAVRIWILARSRTIYPDFNDNSIYALGHKVINMNLAANANRNNFRHRLLVSAVSLNNRQRRP